MFLFHNISFGLDWVGYDFPDLWRCWILETYIQSHTHEHIGTVDLATNHSKTPVNHRMMTESASSFSSTRFSCYKEFISESCCRKEVKQSDSPSVLLLLVFFFSNSFQSLFLSISQSEQRRVYGTSILSSISPPKWLPNKVQLVLWSGHQDTWKHKKSRAVSTLLTHANSCTQENSRHFSLLSHG